MTDYVKGAFAKLVESIEPTGYNLAVIRGIPQNPTFDVAQYEDIIDNFPARDNDVFVATFVKAGTTWTQQIIHLLLRQGEPSGFYGESIPWLEATTSELLNPREAPTWTLAKINDAPSPRYFKTHANVEHLPGQPYRESHRKNIKVIYVARNPKDTAVSLFNHAKNKPEFGYTGSFEKFCEIFLAGKAENGDWFRHVLDWYHKCQTFPDTHLFLQYEDIFDHPRAAVERIAAFLGIAVTPEIVDNVVKHATIDEMRAKASIGLNHLRQGGYGNWRRLFTVALNEFFDDVYRYRMEGSGLTFNFGPNSHGVNVVF
jgi:hypothetical protein